MERHPVEVKVEDLLRSPVDALLPVLSFVPGWNEVSKDNVEVEQLSGAMTNLVYRCKYTSTKGEHLVITRIFGGSDGLFEREHEREIFEMMSAFALGPKLLADFRNGRVEEFWHGYSIAAGQMSEPWLAVAVANALARYHWFGPAFVSNQYKSIWERMRQWQQLVTELWGKSFRQFDLEGLHEQVVSLEALLSARFPQWIGFCHNDLQYGNMLLFFKHLRQRHTQEEDVTVALETVTTRKRGTNKLIRSNSVSSTVSDGDGGFAKPTVRFIDYEYACFNHVAFDIANHWCEYAADYHTEQPHVLDFARLPNEREQTTFTRAYVRRIAKLKRLHLSRPSHGFSRSVSGQSVEVSDTSSTGKSGSSVTASDCLTSLASMVQDCYDEDDIEQVAEALRTAAVSYMAVSHLHWALWGLIQAKQSKVDFDFETYAEQRLSEYERTRKTDA